ncbi:hypothetical protein NDU88_011987 [Pleurodeles waltl]|uniref:Uncharacterized protein n=1 Tax=Pleurodeles waltl TaxID=8319 RepID=A0AAV7S7U8_PLEWA|nr:hypothetical protein NDU88_011987 [Pleurodeles waltl]
MPLPGSAMRRRRGAAQHFQWLKDLQKKIRRDISKEVTHRRYQKFTAEKKTPGHYFLILDKAKEDFLKVIEKLSNNQEFSFQDTLLVFCYLEALLLLKHMPTLCVVNDFQEYKEKTLIGIKQGSFHARSAWTI